jgi:hypothetical protein
MIEFDKSHFISSVGVKLLRFNSVPNVFVLYLNARTIITGVLNAKIGLNLFLRDFISER